MRDRTASEIGEPEAAIFDAHLLLLDDPDLIATARRADRRRGGRRRGRGPTAWPPSRPSWPRCPTSTCRRARPTCATCGNRVVRLLGGASGAAGDVDGVLVAPDLTPAEAAVLDPTPHGRRRARRTAAPPRTARSCCGPAGSRRSSGSGPLVTEAEPGTVIAVDGTTGEVVLDPDDGVLADFRDRAAQRRQRTADALARADEPAVTTDGTTILVGANLGSVADALAATGADLAGLVRTEFCFLGRSAAPTVDEQEAAYRGIAEAMSGRRITLRTLDVGGDKPLDYVPMPREANPFLGVRGIRLALARKDLLTDQLEAIVRVAHDHPVDVMFPMITTVDELLAARGSARRRRADRRARCTGRTARGDHGRGARDRAEVGGLRPARRLPVASAPTTSPSTHWRPSGATTSWSRWPTRSIPGSSRSSAPRARRPATTVLVAVCGELASDEPAVPRAARPRRA